MLRMRFTGLRAPADRRQAHLHHQLTDLGMKLRQLNVAVLLASAALLVEHLGEFLNRLALPRCNLGRVQFVLGRQLGDRLLALDRLKRHLGFELSRESSPRPHGDPSLYRRIHLTGFDGLKCLTGRLVPGVESFAFAVMTTLLWNQKGSRPRSLGFLGLRLTRRLNRADYQIGGVLHFASELKP
jgi:hypothetical protein